MTTLAWPTELTAANRDRLRAELHSLIEQVMNEEMHALDTLDDQFARMAASLLALLDIHLCTGSPSTVPFTASVKCALLISRVASAASRSSPATSGSDPLPAGGTSDEHPAAAAATTARTETTTGA